MWVERRTRLRLRWRRFRESLSAWVGNPTFPRNFAVQRHLLMKVAAAYLFEVRRVVTFRYVGRVGGSAVAFAIWRGVSGASILKSRGAT